MKKHLLLASMLLVGSASMAQSSLNLGNRKPVPAVETSFAKKAEGALKSTTTCANDTAFYTYLKETTEGTNQFWGYTADAVITEWAQTFLNTGSLTVKGISFWGGVQDAVNLAQTLTATVVLYNVDGTNTPTTQIASQTILLTTAVGFKNVMFATPQTVTGNYAVAIKNTSTTDTISIVTNNATTTTYSEGLSHINAPGFGGWYLVSAVATPPDAPEAIIAPIVSYTVTTNYTMSPTATTMCLGTALTFTNTTTPTAILNNRMYCYGAYNAYWNSVPDSIYAWDMGNGSPLQWSTNAAYTYPAAGLDTVTLYTLSGLFNTCIDTKETYLNITPNAAASYTQNATASPLIAFTSTSTGAVTYSWDFGDGSPLDNTANPSHTFAVGTWNVTLTVTSAGGCNTNSTTQVVTILPTGIASSTQNGFNIYPNPSSTGVFNVEMTGTDMTIEVYNTLGEMVHTSVITSTSLDLSGLGAGIYSMKVVSEGKNSMKQIVITK